MILLIPTLQAKVEQIHKARTSCGREILLSLSPGPTALEHAPHLLAHANMWRISWDFWDRWEDLHKNFALCARWASYAGPGHWPDADMLPLGHVGIRSGFHGFPDRQTLFTKDEQITLMTLCCISRSPLMFGGDLRDNDTWTLSLLTNRCVLELLHCSTGNRELYRRDECVAWIAMSDHGDCYVGHFNLRSEPTLIETTFDELGLSGRYRVQNLWDPQDSSDSHQRLSSNVSAHGAKLFKLTQLDMPLAG